MPKLTANQKITFKQNVNSIIEAKPFDKLISTLGPKGKLEETFSLQKEYNEIEMDIPKGLDIYRMSFSGSIDGPGKL